VAWIFPPSAGKIQRHGSALIGAGVTGGFAPCLITPNQFARKEASQEVSAVTSDLGKR